LGRPGGNQASGQGGGQRNQGERDSDQEERGLGFDEEEPTNQDEFGGGSEWGPVPGQPGGQVGIGDAGNHEGTQDEEGEGQHSHQEGLDTGHGFGAEGQQEIRVGHPEHEQDHGHRKAGRGGSRKTCEEFHSLAGTLTGILHIEAGQPQDGATGEDDGRDPEQSGMGGGSEGGALDEDGGADQHSRHHAEGDGVGEAVELGPEGGGVAGEPGQFPVHGVQEGGQHQQPGRPFQGVNAVGVEGNGTLTHGHRIHAKNEGANPASQVGQGDDAGQLRGPGGCRFLHGGGFYPSSVIQALLPFLPLLLAPQEETHPLTGLPIHDPVVDAIYAEEDIQVMETLDALVNGIGPRLTSSLNLQEACEWAADEFRRYGLENVRLEEWGTFPVGFDRRHKRGRLVSPVKMPLVFTTNAWTAGTEGPVRAALLRAPRNAEELTARAGTFGGAWVVCPNSRPRWGSDGDDFRSRLGRFLDEEGIAGILRPTSGELVRTGGSYRIDADALPTRISILVRRDQVRDILRFIENGETVEAEFDIENHFRPGPVPLYNVIGEIPGVEKPEEIVIFGGHLDSWDGATGTQDNGTGTATTLEAARLLGGMNLKPRRTIRFMLWTGEEQGLMGSRAYIKQHPEETERISGVWVHDGGTNACHGVQATPALQPLFEEVFAPIIRHTADAEDEVLRFRIVETEALPAGVGSDHDSYLSAGVPGFFWVQGGRTSYTYIHHTQNDFYEEAVPEYEVFTARMVASAAWRLANLPEMLPRSDIRGSRRRLGVYLEGDTSVVRGLVKDGLAAQAGILEGDKILRIDGAKVAGSRDLRRALRASGKKKDVVVLRAGGEIAFWFDWEADNAGRKEG
jgi:carboxypeptidase Q